MINYSTLANISMETLHKTFLDAFSDYEVKMDIPLLKLQQRLQRTGYIPEASIGASKEDMLVGFLLNSIRSWDGKLTAYDTGTGVMREYRNTGITSSMFKNAVNTLKKMEVEQCLLEVIHSNSSAVHLYKKQGFQISREFLCFNLDKKQFTYVPTHNVEHVQSFSENQWVESMKFWDFNPSWQNSIDSIKAVPDAFIYSIVRIKDTIVGYGIIDKNTGDIPQIAVDKNFRGKGIGSSILADLLTSTASDNINVINIDSQCTSMNNFLLNIGFNEMLKQYEMVLELQ